MKNFDIFIKHEDDIDDSAFNNFIDLISSQKLSLEIVTVPKSGPMAGLEWLLPTATIIYISKPYFEGFLTEMGKDHYGLLKKGLKNLRETFFGDNIKKRILITSSSAPNKTKNMYSFDFSIIAEVKGGKDIKLLLPKEISKDDYEKTIDAFLDFLELYYDNKINNIEDKFIFGETLLLSYDKKSQELEFINPIPNRSKV